MTNAALSIRATGPRSANRAGQPEQGKRSSEQGRDREQGRGLVTERVGGESDRLNTYRTTPAHE